MLIQKVGRLDVGDLVTALFRGRKFVNLRSKADITVKRLIKFLSMGINCHANSRARKA
jgi:hypothetical protein